MTTLTFSQGIVSHATTTGLPGGAQNFLVINGNKVDLHAPVDQPLVSVFSQRDANYLITLSAGSDIQAWGYGAPTGNNGPFDNLVGGGPGKNEFYLYIDINRANGATTYGWSKYEPTSGSTPPSTNPSRPTDKHWYDSINRIMKVWRSTGVPPNYGSWSETIRLFVGKYVYSSSFSSMSVNSPSFIGTTVGLTGQFRAGALIFDVIGNPVLRTDSNNVTVFFTTEDVFTSGLPANASPVSGNRARYETFLVDAIGLTPADAYTIVKFDSFGKVVPLDALTQPNSLWGLIEFPIGASGDLIQVTMSGVVRNADWNWTVPNQQIFVDKDLDGVLTTEEDGYIPLPNQLPVGIAIDQTALLLRRPELALTTGGGSGGVNDHNLLLNIGTNSHTDIDSHIANSTIHFTEGSIDHTNIMNIGTNSHSDIDTHISDTTIHQPLTVEDVLGSPITSVGNVNTIQFNNSSGFDVVDQTGGVVRIDFNSSFNPIIVQGGSPEQVLDASGEEPLKIIAGTNMTITGNPGASPKTITFASTATGSGGISGINVKDEGTDVGTGSPAIFTTLDFIGTGVTVTDGGSGKANITIVASGGSPTPSFSGSRIQDGDNDTFVDTQFSAGSPGDTDPDHIRLETATSSSYSVFGGRIDIGSGTNSYGGEIRIQGGLLNTGTGTSPNISGGASINLNAAVNDRGGNINITAGDHVAYNVGGASIYLGGGNFDNTTGGTITIAAGNGQVGTSPVQPGYNGGEVQIFAGEGTYRDGGAVKIYGGNHIGGGEYNGGYVNIKGGTTSGSGSTRGDISLQGGRILLNADGQGGYVDPVVIIDSTNTNSAPRLAFREKEGFGSSTVSLKAPDSLGSSIVYTLPTLPTGSPFPQYFLTTNANGILSFASASGGGGTPGGSDTQVQYNDSGSFGASSNFTFNDSSSPNELGVTGRIYATDKFYGNDGSAAAPMFTFATEPGFDSGMYRVGSNSIGFSTGTIARLIIESDGTLNTGTTANYETLVTSDDDIPNKRYVDSSLPYDFRVELQGAVPTAGSPPTRIVYRMIVGRACTMTTGLIHQAYAVTGPGTNDATFTLYKRAGGTGTPTAMGSVTFLVAGGNLQSVPWGTGIESLAVGDVIYLEYTNPDDGTLADVSFSIMATTA